MSLHLYPVQMMSLQQYLQIGLVLFVGILIFLGYLGWRQTETMADFAIAGEKLGPYMLGAAFAATFFSASTFVGYVGWAYDFGYSFLWLYLSLISASPIALIIFAKRVRRTNTHMGSVSLPDWIGEFYNSQLLRVGIALALFFNLFYIAGQLTAGAQIFEVLLGWEYFNGLVFVTTLITLYVMVGGTFADVYTDAVQGILMAIMGVVVFASFLWVFDWSLFAAWGEMSAELAAEDQNLVSLLNPESIVFYSGFAILSIFILEFAFSAQPQLFNKVLALDDPDNLRKMIVTYVVLTVCFLSVTFAGFYLQILPATPDTADQSIFVYTMEYFPAIIAAFLGIVILSAAVSTTDGIYVVLATAIANDIFLKFLVEEGHVDVEPERADRLSRYIAQASVVLVSILGFIIVLSPPPYISALVWIGIAGVASATVAPVMVGIYFPNFVTRKGAIAALFTGVLGYLVVQQFLDIASVFVEGTLGLIIATIVMLVVSAVTEQEETVAQFSEQHSGGAAQDAAHSAQPADDD